MFLPERNKKDVLEIPDEVKIDLDIRFMSRIDDGLEVALGETPAKPEPEPAIPPPTAPSRGSMGDRRLRDPRLRDRDARGANIDAMLQGVVHALTS